MLVVPHLSVDGLDRERLLTLVEPVLRAHGVEPVELVWTNQAGGRVLKLTLEKVGAREPGAGVTLDLCAEVSRDLSAALDVADLIGCHFALEVSSPGVERRLYQPDDYARFQGKTAKLVLREPLEGQLTLRGLLRGLDEEGRILVETDWGTKGVAFEAITRAHLVFTWGGSPKSGVGARKGGRRTGQGAARRAPSRSR